MRMADVGENLDGKVCVCSIGRAFVVAGNKVLTDKEGTPLFGGKPMYFGIGFDGKGTVCSSLPCVIADSVAEYHDTLMKRFGGKMSFNG